MYIIYKSQSNIVDTINIDKKLPGETNEQMVQRYIDEGLVPNLPWQDWFEITGNNANFGADFLIPDWQLKTCIINEPAYYKQVEDNVLLQRSIMLQQSDWSQMADTPEATKLAWQPYRQALRDIPSQPGYPMDVIFPTPPKINP